MSLPWVADERRRQQSLREAIQALGGADRRSVSGCPDPLDATATWTFAVLVGWWLKAGYSLHGVSRTGIEELERRVGRGAGDGQYPPLWLATRYTALHLPPEGLPRHVADHDEWKASKPAYAAYLQRLLVWVTTVTGKDRPRPSIPEPEKDSQGWVAALEREFASIRDDAAALLGERFDLEIGPDLTNETLADWVAIWLDCRFEGAAVRRVRQPVVHVAGGRRTPFIKGVAVLPPPGSVVQQAAQRLVDVHSEAAVTAVRVVRALAARWPQSLLPSAAVREKFNRQSPLAHSVDEIILPAVRALVAAVAADRSTAVATGDWQGDLATVRLSLALDRFEVRPVAPPATGDRMIPHRGDPRCERRDLSFVCKAADIDVPVGWLAEPATCDEAVLAAIEDVDWRLWALQRAPWDDATAKVAATVVKAAKPSTWERLKRRILLERMGPETAGELYDFVHARRLDLDMLAGRLGTAAAAVSLDTFIREYATLERIAFEHLRGLGPEALARLDPPRSVDGSVDVAAWLARKRRGETGPSSWRLEWVPDARPQGAVVAEHRAENHYAVQVSAGSMADGDLALLRLEPVPVAAGEDGQTAGSLRRTLAELQAAVAAEFVQGRPEVDVAAALTALRKALATNRAAAFHELVDRWGRGDGAAAAWGRLLSADRRFGFTCHPRIDPATGEVATPSADDPFVEWAFDESVPAGQDVAITFALVPDRARRLISRGRRVAGSPADHAEAMATAAGSHEPLATLTREAVRATDRWTHFPGAAPHPREAARRLLDALLDERGAPADVRAAVFAAARRWCAAIGNEIVPADWAPDATVPPEAVADQDVRHEFHATAPPGSVVVRGFGLRGPDGVPFAGAISAGPAPPGFAPLQEAARALAGAGPAWAAVAQRVDDLAKHVVSDTVALAGSNLFDAVWQAAGDSPAGQEGDVGAVQAGVVAFLKETCRMLPFEPSAMGDYPTAWLRESDGRQPRGRRIRRVVRPGLRTRDNTLVRPALVVTE